MPPLQTASLPEAFSPFRWTGIVETTRSYRGIPVDLLGQFNPDDFQIQYKSAITPSLESAKLTEPFRYFSYFARFPAWSQSPVVVNGKPGTRVELTDLRFGIAGRGSFHCIALENSRYQVLQSLFTFGSGANLGWGDLHGPAVLLVY